MLSACSESLGMALGKPEQTPLEPVARITNQTPKPKRLLGNFAFIEKSITDLTRHLRLITLFEQIK